MKMQVATWLCGVALFGVTWFGSDGMAQAPLGRAEAALAHGAANDKSAYLIFHRDWDQSATVMAQVVKAHADKHADKAIWTTVRVTDPAEKAIVDRFQVGRAPMPLVIAVHPNGAVTGAFPKKVADADLARCLLSPKQAECVKSLQQNRLVLLCVQTAPQPTLPSGVQEFQADPQFANRTQVVFVHRDDPAEAAFLGQLQVDPKAGPLTVFMAPPGVMVGKFSTTASKADLSAAVTAAGKCCDDPNCKHKGKCCNDPNCKHNP